MLEKTQEGPHQVQPIDLSDMIVSPYVNPEAFAKHKYFLTEEQYHTRDSIVNSDKERIVMTGGAGTGKTLVLMDAARTFINQKKMPKESVLVIFCAPMDNYEMISNDLGINVHRSLLCQLMISASLSKMSFSLMKLNASIKKRWIHC
ncbi:UvrD-helicase domain-containing protein [Lacticaseibacillus paracasei]|uniref:UvrD-helicase domain-containing protein n=1 Tax=Lacticaseibacillus paracasei TaxID=1597 RepID=UPI0031DB9227